MLKIYCRILKRSFAYVTGVNTNRKTKIRKTETPLCTITLKHSQWEQRTQKSPAHLASACLRAAHAHIIPRVDPLNTFTHLLSSCRVDYYEAQPFWNIKADLKKLWPRFFF